MRNRRLEMLATAALLLAGAALFVSLQGNVIAAPGRQEGVTAAPAPADAAATAATVPGTFNYQGYLRDGQGKLVNGPQTLTIKIYTAATGGEVKYMETFNNVPVRDGLFNVVLGDGTPLNGALSDSPRFIGITLNGQELLPRQRVHAVPMALLAQTAQTAQTLVPGANVDSLTLNGATSALGPIVSPNGFLEFNYSSPTGSGTMMNLSRLGLNVVGSVSSGGLFASGNANINGSLTLKNTAPILVKRYNGALINNTQVNTGISSADYFCTAGGWFVNMDINEGGYGPWARMMFEDSTTGKWFLWIYNNVHGQTPNPPVYVDVVCFRWEMVNFSLVSAAGATSTSTDAPMPNTDVQPADQ